MHSKPLAKNAVVERLFILTQSMRMGAHIHLADTAAFTERQRIKPVALAHGFFRCFLSNRMRMGSCG